jgi:FtsP/CotA-like multicopper oxidase with cupredoxin domain/peroxiredoxin
MNAPQQLLHCLIGPAFLMLSSVLFAQDKGESTPGADRTENLSPVLKGHMTLLQDRIKNGKLSPFRNPGVLSERSGATLDRDELMKIMKRMSPAELRLLVGEAVKEGEDAVLAALKGWQFRELEIVETDPAKVRPAGLDAGVDFLRYADPHQSDPENPDEIPLCGPTILMKRGQPLVVDLENRLDPKREPVMSAWKDGLLHPTDWTNDVPTKLFNSNLHTHGLHVSPVGNHDNVLGLHVAPGQSVFLDYTLRREHPAGTFWYHAHMHGSVAYQLSNGMTGALIVLGDQNNASDLESIPEIRNANMIVGDAPDSVHYGRVFLLEQLMFCKASVKVNGALQDRYVVNPGVVNDRKMVDGVDGSNNGKITEGVKPDEDSPNPYLAVNGVGVMGPVQMPRGALERWRFIHAGKENPITLSWYRLSDGKLVDDIKMYGIATDGIPTGTLDQELPKAALYPGYRLDVLMQIPKGTKEDTYALVSDAAASLTKNKKVNPGEAIFLLTVKGDIPAGEYQPLDLGTPSDRLTELKGELIKRLPHPKFVDKLEAIPRKYLAFHFDDTREFGVTDATNNIPVNGDGLAFSDPSNPSPIELMIGRAEHWCLSVVGAKDGANQSPQVGLHHPFHMHVNSFWVPSVAGANWPHGVWRDTLMVDGTTPGEIYFQPEDFAGTTVLHCHVLDHEDQGMMRMVNIVDHKAESFPKAIYLRPVKSPTANGSASGLGLTKGKINVVEFITGESCPHCLQQMRELQRLSRVLVEMGASVSVVIYDPLTEDDLKAAGVERGAGLKIVNDRELFKSQGLLKPEGPLHGSMVFDAEGQLRQLYEGETPLPEPQELLRAVLELKQ